MSLLSPPAPGTQDFDTELVKLGPVPQEAARNLREFLAAYGVEGELPLRPASLSFKNAEDRQNFRTWCGLIHVLPNPEQQKLPSIIRLLGRAAWAFGEFQAAQRDFHNLGEGLADPAAKAEAYHQAYLAALERPHLNDALYELKFAIALDPVRFAPFPLEKFEPEKIVAADGFGLLCRCKLRGGDGMVSVRTADMTDLELSEDELLALCERLKEPLHPSLLRLGSAAFHDQAPHRLVMMAEFLEGHPLDHYLHRHGALNVRDAVAIGKEAALGLQAAHAAGLVHRAVRPSNVNVLKQRGGIYKVVLGDCGIAPRMSLLRQASAQAAELVRTLAGRTLVGAADFAAPEQAGKGTEAISSASDVYSWAKTLCFTLFATPHPAYHHWQKLPEELARLLNQCLQELPADRPCMNTVVETLANLAPQAGPAAATDGKEAIAAPVYAAPPGVGQAFEPKKVAGVASRRRLTPIEQLKIRIQRLTLFYGLIGLGILLALSLAYVVFFYKPTVEAAGIAPVMGKLLLLGNPVADAKITFVPEDRGGVAARGETNAKGEFVLTSLLPKDGAYPGTYKVVIEKDQKKIKVSPTLPGNDPGKPFGSPRINPLFQLSEVNERYSSASTTPLLIVIPKEGNLNLEISLSLQPR